MIERKYKDFSINAHKNNLRLNKASVCQFELTFRCGLHCRHCYTDCYNAPAYFEKELRADKVKLALDKIRAAGALWLCFTGGDPLSRTDFPDIYSYAKEKGFIITIFTGGYSVDGDMVKCLKEKPPFLIKLTLNAVTEGLYENISQVRGSFRRVTNAIDMILRSGLPLQIDTQVTRDNLRQVPEIKRFVGSLGVRHIVSAILYPRLNGDLAPCDLRISPGDILSLGGEKQKISKIKKRGQRLFYCAAGGGDGFYVDPYGGIFLCELIRRPNLNLFKTGIEYALNALSSEIRNKGFLTNSRCRACALKDACQWCPGEAYLEKGSMESPIEYYCKLAESTAVVGRKM